MENVVHEPQKTSGVGDPPTGDALGRASRRERAGGGHRSRRQAWGTALAVGLGVAALGGTPTAALAADNCPNAAVRAQQGVQHLPNCMAYEKLTPNEKYGANVMPDSELTADGSGVSVWSTTHLFATDDPGVQQLSSAFRGPDGWEFLSLSNAKDWGKLRASAAGTNDVAWRRATSDDLRSLIFFSAHPLDPNDLGHDTSAPGMSSFDLYLSKPDGSRVWASAPVSGSVPLGSQAGTAPRFWRASSDVSRAVFDSTRVLDPAADGSVRLHVWLFQDGKPIEVVDRLPDGTVSTATQDAGGLSWLSLDGERRVSNDARRIVFLSSALHGQAHVYARVDAGTPQARTLLVSASSAGTPCPVTPTFNSITEDGRWVRFTCAAQLTLDAPAAGGAYVRNLDTGVVEYDTPETYRGSPAVTNRNVTDWSRPEGTYRVSGKGLNWGSGQQAHLVRTELATGTEVCVTCIDGGPTPGAPQSSITSYVGGMTTGPSGGAGMTARGIVTPDGEVVFRSHQRLVPEDTNSFSDLYMWKDGKHYLLSSGTAQVNVEFGGVSMDGSTISFGTTSALVPEDRDAGQRDVYVLRKNGGFLRSGEASECTSGCQGPALPMTPVVAPLSLAFPASGDAVDDGVDPIAVSGSRTVRGTSLKVKVRTPGAGRVTVSGNGLRKASRSLKSEASASLTVKLSARSQRLLRKRSSVKVKATVRFVPAEGKAQTKRVNLTFRKKAASKKKGSSRSVVAASNGKAAR